MEAENTCKTMVNFYQTTWHYNPEDSYLQTRHQENLKSYLSNNIIYHLLPPHDKAVDEAITGLKGRFHLKQYISQKPTQWGLTQGKKDKYILYC
jgi:hypothetical protein